MGTRQFPAHRIGHAIFYSGDTGVIHYSQEMKKLVDKAYSTFSFFLRQSLPYFKYSEKFRKEFNSYYSDERYYTKVINLLGTMNSARKNNLTQSGEFLVELMAQYLIQGRVKFNRVELDSSPTTPFVIDPKDQKLFDMADGRSWHWDDGEAFANDVLERPMPPGDHWLAYDADGNPFASGNEESMKKYSAQGYVVKFKPVSPQAKSAYEKKLKERARVAALFDQWIAENRLNGSLGKNATDRFFDFLDSMEKEFNSQIDAMIRACVGKVLMI